MWSHPGEQDGNVQPHMAQINNFVLGEGQEELLGTSSSDEYIDDYYASSHHQRFTQSQKLQGMSNNNNSASHMKIPHQFIPTELEIIREHPTTMTSAQPSTISSSDVNDLVLSSHTTGPMNKYASTNVALIGQAQGAGPQSPVATGHNSFQSFTGQVPLSAFKATPQKQVTTYNQHESHQSSQPSMDNSGMMSIDQQSDTLNQLMQGKTSLQSFHGGDAIGCGLLPTNGPIGAGAVPGFFGGDREQQHSQDSFVNHQLPQQVHPQPQPLPQHQINQIQQQQQQKQQLQPTVSKTKKDKTRRKRKVNDDYGIFYNYTGESDSSQTPTAQSKEMLQTQQPVQISPMDTKVKAIKSLGNTHNTSSMNALRNAAALARNTVLAAEDKQKHVNSAPSLFIQEEGDVEMQRLEVVDRAQVQPQGRNVAIADQYTLGNNFACNSILPPNVTISSGEKLHEDKSFRHGFYSIDAADANDQLGANPISLGMTNDFGLTLTQTGFEGFIDDELMLEMVMSRVDWIIQLRDIFYNLLEQAASQRQNGYVQADKLMRKLLSLQDTLTLVPKDEYQLGLQRHEVAISYGTILSNLRRRMIDHQREASQQLTLGKPPHKQQDTVDSVAKRRTLEQNLANCNLTLQLDDVIDLPFRRGAAPAGYSNTGKLRHEAVNSFQSQDKKVKVGEILNKTQTNFQLFGTQQSPAIKSEMSPKNPTELDSKNNDRIGHHMHALEKHQNRSGQLCQQRPNTQINILKQTKTRSSAPATRLSSFDSHSLKSTSEPDLNVLAADESRQQVYGTKRSQRGNKHVGSRSKRRGRHKTKSTSPHRGDRKQSTMSPMSSAADGEADNLRNTQQKQNFRSSLSSFNFNDVTNLKKPSSRTRKYLDLGKKTVNSKKSGSRRMSQIVMTENRQNEKGGGPNTHLTSSTDHFPPQSITPGDSQVQLLSIDAFRYATQSPPTTMVTKSLLQNKKLNAHELGLGRMRIDDPLINNVIERSRNVITPGGGKTSANGSISPTQQNMRGMLQLLTPEKAEMKVVPVNTNQILKLEALRQSIKGAQSCADNNEPQWSLAPLDSHNCVRLTPTQKHFATVQSNRINQGILMRQAVAGINGNQVAPRNVQQIQIEAQNRHNVILEFDRQRHHASLSKENANGSDPSLNTLFEHSPMSHQIEPASCVTGNFYLLPPESNMKIKTELLSHAESELLFPAPISIQQQLMLQAAKNIQENNSLADGYDDRIGTAADFVTAYQEETKTSVLQFDHQNVLTGLSNTNQNLETIRLQADLNSPPRTWAHLFDSEQRNSIAQYKPTQKQKAAVESHTSNKSFGMHIMAFPKPMLSTMRPKMMSLERIVGSGIAVDESASRKEFFDIDLADRAIKESPFVNDLELRKGIKSHLRSINLSQNLLRAFYELGQTEARQLLILNLSMNQISSLQEVALCSSLQFLNLAHNCISDANEVNRLRKLKNLQELYLSHNQVSFAFNRDLQEVGGVPSRRNYQAIWPALEVLDLSANKSTEITQIEFLFSAQFVVSAVIRVIAVSGGTLADDTMNDELLLQDEKIPQQISFGLTYEDVICQHSRFIASSSDHTIVRACLGVADFESLKNALNAHQVRIQADKHYNSEQQQNSENIKQRKKTNALNWILSGSFSAKKTNGMRNTVKVGAVRDRDQAVTTTQQSLGQQSEPKASVNCASIFDFKQTGTHKTPVSSQNHSKKKKILRIVSPNNHGTESLKHFAKEQPQTCKASAQHTNKGMAKAGTDVRRSSLKMSGPSKKKSGRRVPTGKLGKKHGIQQIQMVYLNPSHAGSRRSSSIRSNRSASGSCSDRFQPGQSQQAYHRDGGSRKSKRQPIPPQGAIPQAAINGLSDGTNKRNKSISSGQSQKLARILSPSVMIYTTPKFDSCEALPKQSEQLRKGKLGEVEPARMLRKEDKTKKGPASMGVSHFGISAHDPDALKLSSPPQLSPTIPSMAEKGSRNHSKTPKPLAIPQQCPSSTVRFKIKGGCKGSKKEITAHRSSVCFTNSDSFLNVRPTPTTQSYRFNHQAIQNNNNKSQGSADGSTNQPVKGKRSKLKVLRAKGGSSKQKSQLMSREASHDGSFIGLKRNSELPITQNVYHLQLKNIKTSNQSSQSKTVIHQGLHQHQATRSGLGLARKTPTRDVQSSNIIVPNREDCYQREMSGSLHKRSKHISGIQPYPLMSNQQSMKQMTLTQNTSMLLQKLQIKNKQGLLATGCVNKTKKLRVISNNFTGSQHGGGSISGKQEPTNERHSHIPLSSSPLKDKTQKAHASRIAHINSTIRSFRLFTTQTDKVEEGAGASPEPHQRLINQLAADEDDDVGEVSEQQCEAMIACENLPNEPLMPRSHKSSARSFFKGIGSSTRDKQSRSFLQNVSQTSKHTNSTGLNSSQILGASGAVVKPPVSLTAPTSKAQLHQRPPTHQ